MACGDGIKPAAAPRTAGHRAEFVAALREAGADVVGCNCSITADQMVELVAELRAATDAPLLVEPDEALVPPAIVFELAE